MQVEKIEEFIKGVDRTNPVWIYFTNGTYSRYSSEKLSVAGEWLENVWGSMCRIDEIDAITQTPPLDSDIGNTLGSDPEFFFTKDGDVVPSTLVLTGREDRVVKDGFQGELNPHADTCRQVAGAHIGRALLEAYRIAQRQGLQLSLKVAHIISEPVWKNAPLTIKKFGCNPTINAHEKMFRRVTGLREKFRAAGGHIHVGGLHQKEKDDATKLVTLMDIFVGNTCVLIDRDPDNAIRRKNYGRAGEYRLKSYGIEYRVLSNFWLRHYILWSFCTALIRNALAFYRHGLYDEVVSKFDLKKVRQAINENNYDLALENFKILKQIVIDKIALGQGLNAKRADKVERWLTSEDPLFFCKTMSQTIDSWESIVDTYDTPGFEVFIEEGITSLDDDDRRCPDCEYYECEC